jgi:hypothetical protein
VNRRGAPPAIRACLLNERTSMREYVHDLKGMSIENEWFDKPPRAFGLADGPELKHDYHKNARTAFEHSKLLTNRYFRNEDTRVSR